ncbi:hypothetical protein P775_12995 [Puniceibacterium antarcticum]|uniref:Amidohydrolase-related domain-containing protein n=1 Tax=Puniceibacterium antarcticum TaxID=1206336 RepID=A0A2G8RE23_9RHOB|nr:DUF6282 family protein [Puniceibacterium antarcticum]PIL19762.1 hypothetical protein P775_12995 [Puniceibacterium antarcticum]
MSEKFYATEPAALTLPGADLLVGAVDGHVHACPHINHRSIDVLQAVQQAADAGMRAIGLMDNFANSSGMAALANRHLGHLGVETFGGLIMEPAAGGIDADNVRIALKLGFGAPGDGARFISLPTHHTRHTARLENRAESYVAECLAIPESGALPEPLPEIMDLVAEADVVLNTGHLSAVEALRVVEEASARGVSRILVPSSHFDGETVRDLTGKGAHVEFSFFFVTHATQTGLTHVDAARNTVPPVSATQMAALIAAAPGDKVVVSGDCGVFLLPPPVEGLREFLLLLESCGVPRADLRRMVQDTPAALFRIGQ